MKQRIKPEIILLVLLFLFVLVFRLYFTFQQEGFNTDSAYFHLRHIEHLVEEKNTLEYDELSYSGRNVLYPSLFHFIMAFFSFGSMFLLKLIPELLIAFSLFLVYSIAREISGNNYSAVFSAMLFSFIPVLLRETLNSLSVYSLVIPLLLLMLYSLLRLDNKKYLWIFIICSFLLPLIHTSSIIFVATVIIYLFLIAGGALSSTKLKSEAILFSVLLIVLLNLITFKRALLQYGANFIWQSIPSNVLSDSFRQLSPLDLLISVGFLPLILGAIGIYIGILRDKKKVAYLFGAFAIAALVLLVLRLLTISVGLLFLGVALSIFAAPTVYTIYSYLDKIKINYAKTLFVVILLLLFFGLSFRSSFLAAKDSNIIGSSRIKDMGWLVSNTDNESVVLGSIEDGNLIATVAKRKNVIDSDFLFAPNPIERAKDIDIIYSTVSEAAAMGLIKKYNISTIYLSDATKFKYDIQGLVYADSSPCFENFREGKFYVVKC